MIDYKLALELKKAGFPQPESKKDNLIVGSINRITENGKLFLGGDDGWAYIPTLSELIEACGDRFRTLILGREGYPNKEEKWTCHGDEEADGWDDDNDWRGSFNGKTPEEAVANLWLKLNK